MDATETKKTMKCPACAEEILQDAKMCRYCHVLFDEVREDKRSFMAWWGWFGLWFGIWIMGVVALSLKTKEVLLRMGFVNNSSDVSGHIALACVLWTCLIFVITGLIHRHADD